MVCVFFVIIFLPRYYRNQNTFRGFLIPAFLLDASLRWAPGTRRV